ncbi:MAG TPA: TPM domain-containing protein, partial [Acidobacteriota bacterium]
MRGNDPKTFFTEEEQKQIARTIEQVEQETAGEICVRIERECKKDVLTHCHELLDSLGISATA